MAKVLTALFEAFTAASPVRRLLLVLLLILPVAALVAAYIRLNQPPYKVLYVKLSDRAGGEVMAALERLDIPYRLSEVNGVIEVPGSQLYAARFKLAAQGLPKPESNGLDALDNTSTFGLSQFQEQLRYQRSLEAELARSIETVTAVATARVHLALPKSSPFLRDPPPATAAVLVQLKPQEVLADEQVSAIQLMVAASVPRLGQSEVSVLDQHGRLLGAAPGGTANQLRRTALEADLARRVIDVLAPWLGADSIRVQVTATLADSETMQTVERYRTIAGKARPVEKSVHTTRTPEGRLRRLNAAVILGLDASPEQIEKATSLTRQALGFDARRGDSLSVFALPPNVPPQRIREVPISVSPAIPSTKEPVSWFSAAGAAVLLAVLLWLGLRKRRSRLAKSQPAMAEQDTAPAGEAFDSLLLESRRQTLDNPRVTADVVRLWMRA